MLAGTASQGIRLDPPWWQGQGRTGSKEGRRKEVEQILDPGRGSEGTCYEGRAAPSQGGEPCGALQVGFSEDPHFL